MRQIQNPYRIAGCVEKEPPLIEKALFLADMVQENHRRRRCDMSSYRRELSALLNTSRFKKSGHVDFDSQSDFHCDGYYTKNNSVVILRFTTDSEISTMGQHEHFKDKCTCFNIYTIPEGKYVFEKIQKKFWLRLSWLEACFIGTYYDCEVYTAYFKELTEKALNPVDSLLYIARSAK